MRDAMRLCALVREKLKRTPRRSAVTEVIVRATAQWQCGDSAHSPSATFQCPPLSGPMRANFPVDLNSRIARSTVRSDFPSRVAISGIESSGISLSKSRTFPDVFPDIFPEPLAG